jgi:hypothetical protein
LHRANASVGGATASGGGWSTTLCFLGL